MGKFALLMSLVIAGGCQKPSPKESAPAPGPALNGAATQRESLLRRAKSVELNTAYVPPPGETLDHHAAALAEAVCSGVFVSGFSPEFLPHATSRIPAPGSVTRDLSPTQRRAMHLIREHLLAVDPADRQ
jgi:hypothetical protein